MRPRRATGWSRKTLRLRPVPDDTQLARELATSPWLAVVSTRPICGARRGAVRRRPCHRCRAFHRSRGAAWPPACPGTRPARRGRWPATAARCVGAAGAAPGARPAWRWRGRGRAGAHHPRRPSCAAGAVAGRRGGGGALGTLADAERLCAALPSGANLDVALAAAIQRLPHLQQPHEERAPQITLVGLAPATPSGPALRHRAPRHAQRAVGALRRIAPPDDIVEAVAVAIAPWRRRRHHGGDGRRHRRRRGGEVRCRRSSSNACTTAAGNATTSCARWRTRWRRSGVWAAARAGQVGVPGKAPADRVASTTAGSAVSLEPARARWRSLPACGRAARCAALACLPSHPYPGQRRPFLCRQASRYMLGQQRQHHRRRLFRRSIGEQVPPSTVPPVRSGEPAHEARPTGGFRASACRPRGPPGSAAVARQQRLRWCNRVS